MLTCNECEQLVSEYLDDRLDDLHMAEMHSHCTECKGCRSFLSTLLRLSLGARHASAAQVPVGLDKRVRSTVAAKQRGTRNSILSMLTKQRIAIPIPIAAVLALFLIVTGIYALIGPSDRAQVQVIRRQPMTQVMSLPAISIENN